MVVCIKRYEPFRAKRNGKLPAARTLSKKPRFAIVTAYLDLSATCTLGRVAPAQCKCYFELDFRKMTVAGVKRQFGNFVRACGAAHVPRVPKISSFLAVNKVVARAGSAQP